MQTVTCPRHGPIISWRPDGTCWCGAICDVEETEWQCLECGWHGTPKRVTGRNLQSGGYAYFTVCPECGDELMEEAP